MSVGLRGIGVLELVDQDGPEALRVALADRRMLGEEAAGLHDQVVEGEDAVEALAGLDRVVEIAEERREAPRGREPGEEAVLLGQATAEPHVVEGQIVLHRVLEACLAEERAERAQLDEVGRGRVGAEGPEPRLPGRPFGAQRGAALRLASRRLERGPHGAHDPRHGPGEPHLARGGERFLALQRRREPRRVVAHGAEPAEEADAQPERPPTESGAEATLAEDELTRCRVAAPEARHQLGLHRRLDVRAALLLVEDRRPRVDPRLDRILAHDPRAEGVDGRYLCPEEIRRTRSQR